MCLTENETQRYVNHHVSALDPLHDVSPDGRHHPRDGLGRGLKPVWGANPGRLAVRNAGARRTAIGVRHCSPTTRTWKGPSRWPGSACWHRFCLSWGFRCRSQASFEALSPNSCIYRCSRSKCRSGCGCSSRESPRKQLDEPARQKENVGRSRPARHESRCTSNLYSAPRVIEKAWEHSCKV